MSIVNDLQLIYQYTKSIKQTLQDNGIDMNGVPLSSMSTKIEKVINNSSSSGTANFNMMKISQFQQQITAISAIVVDGFGTVQVYQQQRDYSQYNGTYIIQSSTFNAILGRQRIYKHSTENYYLYTWDWDTWGSPAGQDVTNFYWCFDSASGSSYDSCLVSKYGTDQNPTAGKYQNGMQGFSFTLTMNYIQYQVSPRILKGYNVTNYSNGVFTYDTEQKNYTSQLSQLKQGFIYGINNTVIVNGPITFGGGTTTTSGLVFYAPLSSQTSTAQTGQSLSYHGVPLFNEFDGMNCLYLSGTNENRTYVDSLTDSSIVGGVFIGKTISFWGKPEYGGQPPAIHLGDQYRTGLAFCAGNGISVDIRGTNDTSSKSIAFNDNKLHHYAYTTIPYRNSEGEIAYKGYVYFDGVKTENIWPNGVVDTNNIRIGSYADNWYDASGWKGYMAKVRIYNRALSDVQIYSLYNNKA